MADPDLRTRADERFARALADAGARDPRDFYRKQMKALRELDATAYRRALEYFTDTLIPRVAGEESDAIGEWLEYGRLLATLTTPGRTVQIDASGRARDYSPPVPRDALVLHLPESTSQPALIVGLPPRLTPPQRAAHELLVAQSQGS